MDPETIEKEVEEYLDGLRMERNMRLRERIARGRTFEELLAELSALSGFNVEERLTPA